MPPDQTIAPWLAMLSDSVGVDPPQEQSPGHYLLHSRQAPELRITVPEELPIVRLFAVLGPVPAADRRRLLLTLLQWNLLGQKTNGAALALNPDDSQVTLTYGHPLDHLDGEGFVTLVENFLATAQTLRAELAETTNLRGSNQGGSASAAMPIQALRG